MKNWLTVRLAGSSHADSSSDAARRPSAGQGRRAAWRTARDNHAIARAGGASRRSSPRCRVVVAGVHHAFRAVAAQAVGHFLRWRRQVFSVPLPSISSVGAV